MKMLEVLFYSLSGLFMKVSDDAHDRRKNNVLGLVAAIICGISIGYLAVTSADAACIFLAILIGTLASWKVDCRNHLLSLFIFVGIILIFGFPTVGVITLAICALAAFLDEVGNDSQWAANKRYVKEFFQYRFALKIIILLFAVMGLLITIFPQQQIWGVQYFAPLTFLYFLIFELSYELVGLKFDAIYDGLESLVGVFRSVNRSSND